MSSIERFWFANSGLRLRTSTVKRFGGFSTASFCSEARLPQNQIEPSEDEQPVAAAAASKTIQLSSLSAFGW